MTDAIVFGLLFFAALLAVRNEITYRIMMKENRLVHLRSVAAIDAGDPDWLRFHRALDAGPTYDETLWDLTKWTHKQVYGDSK